MCLETLNDFRNAYGHVRRIIGVASDERPLQSLRELLISARMGRDAWVKAGRPTSNAKLNVEINSEGGDTGEDLEGERQSMNQITNVTRIEVTEDAFYRWPVFLKDPPAQAIGIAHI